MSTATRRATCDIDPATLPSMLPNRFAEDGNVAIHTRQKELTMKGKNMLVIIAGALAVAAGGLAISAQDKYALKVPNGLAFAEFKGYENWQLVSTSHGEDVMAAILANPVMIEAFRAGAPGNGKPFPDGAKMAKIHWNPKKQQFFPTASVPASQHDVDFMVKDSKRFAVSGGWGYAVFEYDATSKTFRPGDQA